MDIGVTGIVTDVFVFQAAPDRRRNNLARLRLNITKADFFVPFWMKYVVAEGSVLGNSMWISSILLLILASHFANLLLRGILKISDIGVA